MSSVMSPPELASDVFFNDTAPTEIYTLSLHDPLPICSLVSASPDDCRSATLATTTGLVSRAWQSRSEEHTSELQSLRHLVCRLLLEKKNNEEVDVKDDTSLTEDLNADSLHLVELIISL